MRDFGFVRPGTTLYIPFATYDSNDPTASVTTSGLAVTDIEIYKDGGTTQRASDSGYALLDTDGIDFDGLTGIHGFSVDLADNTTSGFYTAGSQFWVVVSSITVDAGTVSFIAATFRIGLPDAVYNTTIATLSSQTSFTLTAGPAEDDALNGCVAYIHDVASAVQCGFAVISDYTGSTKTVTLTAGTTFTAAAGDNISIFPPANPKWFGATAVTGRDIGASVLVSPGTGTGQISLSSGAVTVGTNNDKTGYTASTVSDKTGYSLTATTGLGNQTANITGNLSGSVGSVTGAVGSVASGGITAASIATDAIDNDAIAADVSAVIADAVWNALTASYGSANTYGALIESGNVGGGAIVAASVSGAVGSVTGNVGGNVSGSVGSVASGGITAASIADNAIDLATFAADCKTGSALKANVETITAGAITAAAIATGAIDADALAADAVDEILDEVVEGTLTVRQVLRILLAALAGKTTGGNTTTPTFRDLGDTKARISATVDTNNNRTAITLDGS